MEEFEIGKAINLITDKVESWITTFVEMLPNFIIACLVVVAFWLVAKLLRKLLTKALRKVTQSDALIKLSGTLIYVATIAVGTFVALSVLHLDKAVTSMLAGIGVIGLALGFAFQDIAANFVAGVLIATRRPFKLDDLVETNGYLGTIIDINLRSSTIRTFQGQDVIIPNKEVFQNPLTNYSNYPKRRIDLEVGVSYGDDLEKVKEIALKAIDKLSMIDSSMETSFIYTGFGDSSINFTVRYWVDEHKQPHYLEALSAGVMAVKKAFDENDITIPFPIRTLDFGIKGGMELSETKLNILDNTNAN